MAVVFGLSPSEVSVLPVLEAVGVWRIWCDNEVHNFELQSTKNEPKTLRVVVLCFVCVCVCVLLFLGVGGLSLHGGVGGGGRRKRRGRERLLGQSIYI